MSDTPYTQGFRAGQDNERERIIKLLEAQNGDWADCICIDHIHELIVFIKGKNK